MGVISRFISGEPKCRICKRDSTGYVEGQPYCPVHKRQMKAIAGPKADRRQR